MRGKKAREIHQNQLCVAPRELKKFEFTTFNRHATYAGKPKPSREDDGREVESDLDARIIRVKKNTQLLVAREVNQLARSDIFYRLGYEFVNDAMKPEDQRSQLGVTHEGQHDLTFYIERVRDEAVGMVESMTQMTQVGGAPGC